MVTPKDCGEGVTHISPIYDGYVIPHAIIRTNLGGRDVTNYLIRILTERGCYFRTMAEQEIVRAMKEKLSRVTLNFETEMKSEESIYELPDKQKIFIGNEKYRCMECLFQPALLGSEIPGIHENLYKSIFRTDIDLRRILCNNIVFSGGTTLSPGIAERTKKELETLVPSGVTINIDTPAERKHATWLGGSILASLSSFKDEWITTQEYNEVGDSILYRKQKIKLY
jgi:actin-related protein